MEKCIYIETSYGLTRMAVTEDGKLVEFYLQEDMQGPNVGNIYKGVVKTVLPGMQAAFVDIGIQKNSYLYAEDAAAREFLVDDDGKAARKKTIGQMVFTGQEILVQVKKEQERSKGARVTTQITLPGHLMVLTPMDAYIGISKRIQDERHRAQIKQLAKEICPSGMGLIVRTAAQDADRDAFVSELAHLLSLWEEIQKNANGRTAPFIVHSEDSLLPRAIRDHLKNDVARLYVSSKGMYKEAVELSNIYTPALTGRIRFHNNKMPLFDFYSLEKKIEQALHHKVNLKSGGTLVIDETEALTVIDVNSARFIGKHNLQETALQLNLEAAKEIARQLRLRDIGGIVIIDFVDMDTPEYKNKVLEELKNALRADRNQTSVVGLTGLGLVEMTRRKTRKRLSSALEALCPVCAGSSYVVRDEHLARRALREIARKRISVSGDTYEVIARPQIAKWMRKWADKTYILIKEDEYSKRPYEILVKKPENDELAKENR